MHFWCAFYGGGVGLCSQAIERKQGSHFEMHFGVGKLLQQSQLHLQVGSHQNTISGVNIRATQREGTLRAVNRGSKAPFKCLHHVDCGLSEKTCLIEAPTLAFKRLHFLGATFGLLGGHFHGLEKAQKGGNMNLIV